MIQLVAACSDPPGPTCEPGLPHLLLATTDYEAGALAAVDLDGSCVADPLASSGPDPLVRWLDDRVAVADRSGGNAVRLYSPGDYAAPEVEFAAVRGGNVHDLARVGDELWLAEYDLHELLVTDLEGRERARVDLSAHADADGLPETDRVVVADGRPLVAVQRLAREGSDWPPAGDGRVLELDPDTREVVRWWDAGPDPKVVADPVDPGGLVVLTGVFYVPDGALHTLDADGLSAPIVTEEALGYDLTGVAGVGEDLVILGHGFDPEDPATVDCVRRDGTVTPGLETDAWPVDLVAGEGAVWVAVRTGWAGAFADRVLRVDPATCAIEELASGFTLDPFAIALVPGHP